ncbi:hypothetical protein PIB30_043890 [Stylosanthes scabra]|uniref:ADP-ribosyl cyclase/cyclic ADP-ribose hydrolase n=1 Tax=Stylosanthes scabra TaxID=79078 RepID=A0ABU6TFB1_9FABA|nr:hypothetical protein [Stylosanthes scabra]
MSSSSSCASVPPPPPRACTYHVFLSFRGEDTRGRFTSHLYEALNRKGITTYRDDNNLRKGDVISDELLKAIEESMFAVIVLSPNYASSTWCLDELCKILDCKNKLGLHLEVVFYGVKPCDVRHQIGAFQEAFKKHQQRHDSHKVKRWKDALSQVADYSGWSSQNRDEAVLVEKIAQHIHEMLIPKLPSSMKELVGIESRVKQVISHMGLGLNDVRYIGIWGMGGMGKTTIARAVFEAIRDRFEVTCFLADVREHCEKNDIIHIQKQLLDQMNISSKAVYSEYDGRIIIQNSLRLKKVLLVLDDVNHEKQLENLAGGKDGFGSGSRIIITTRDVEVLKEQEMHATYKVEGLVETEAFNLFSLKAFKLPKPTEEFLDLSKEVVKYSGGLPLALIVLGIHLRGRSIAVWHSAIEKIKNSSNAKIIDVLKISYDGLDSEEKNIFLDIACFFKGCGKDYATKILEECGHHAEIGIDVLINKSLVTVEQDRDGKNILGMHDLLEEMGKQIVIQESLNDASKRSRLWCFEDVDSVLNQKKETEATHSIVLHNMQNFKTEVRWKHLAFSNIGQLKLLILGLVNAPILSNIPCSLRVLLWKYCPLKTLSLTDQRYELVEIDLSNSQIAQLWDGTKFLENLKHLDLSFCTKLKQTPDVSGAPNLKTLNLEECENLNYIHPSLAHHKSLVELNLRYCDRLQIFADKLEMSSLEKLDLHGCTSLRKLPEFGECMTKLSILCLGDTYIKELPKTFENLVGLSELYLSSLEYTDFPVSLRRFVGLKKLRLGGCRMLYLPYSIRGLESLTVSHCSDIPNIHECFVSLAWLTDLDMSSNSFVKVPISSHELPRLTRLKLNRCRNLQVLPELPSRLRELQATNCKSLHLSEDSNAISKACCVFAESATQDGEEEEGLLQMLISGKEIPAWFVHQREKDTILVPLLRNCPSTEIMALALCFMLESDTHYDIQPKVTSNGKEFINKSLFQMKLDKYSQHLFIVCLTGNHISNLLGQYNHFRMVIPSSYGAGTVKVKRSGARWVCKKDIQDFKK